jgi:CRP-like cAMP-binding protein
LPRGEASAGEGIRAALDRVPLFQGLEPSVLDALARVVTTRRIRAGEVLFYQDDPGDSAYIVSAGEISIVLSTADGRELEINSMRAGDYFGEIALLTGEPRTAGAVARTAAELLVIPRQAFMSVLLREPRLMQHLLETVARRLRSSTERERALAFLDAPARLARVLLALDRAEQARGYITISQDELARRIGVARQTTAKILGQWRRAGWLITGRGRIVLVNRTALAHRAETAE